MVSKAKKMRSVSTKRNGISMRKTKEQPADIPELDDSASENESDFDIAEVDYHKEDEEKKVQRMEEDESENGDDSDRELQIALRDGLLKSGGLNIMVDKKKPIINKVAEIREKITVFSKNLPWIETVDVTTENTLTNEMINDDFEREMQFYKQAEKAVQIAVPRLLSIATKVLRPPDYYAEMAKSDDHMQKVRTRLLKLQEGKERQEAIRRMREEKKYATKVQKQVIDKKHEEKKALSEAVKKHKKGMKQQLEDMLNNVKRMELDQEDDEPPARGPPQSSNRGRFAGGDTSRSRNQRKVYKSDKFGYGGRKKGLKRNDKESFDNEYIGRKKSVGWAGSIQKTKNRRK